MPQSEQKREHAERRPKPHDAAYKSLFGHARCVKDLVAGFAPEIASHLDFPTLEKVESSFVTPALERRHADSIWKVRSTNGNWCHVLVLLEFQSTVEPKMAKRILDYTLRLMEAHDAEGGGLPYPPVFPIVIYNGKRPWTAATDVGELFGELPGDLLPCLPSNWYLLLELRRLGRGKLPPKNAVSMIVKLERDKGSGKRVMALWRELKRLLLPGERELVRSFRRWMARVLVEKSADGGQEFLDLVESEENKEGNMSELAGQVRKGRELLLAQGMARGVEQGQRDMARRMAARKFGAAGAKRLVPVLAGISDPERMATVASMVYECETVEELIERAANGN